MTNSQEQQWREEFENEVISNPYACGSDISREVNGEYIHGAVQSKWLWYLSACKKRTEEQQKSSSFAEGEALGRTHAIFEQRQKNEKALEEFNNLLFAQLDNDEYEIAIKTIKQALEAR
jgi:hypothetical protein